VLFSAVEDRSIFGQDDIFFTREGGEAYLKDLPRAEMHRLDSGHFAVEDSLEEIAANIKRFYEDQVASGFTGKRKSV
jgi:pimeloyl-ACP methyl ester carboxylesterase